MVAGCSGGTVAPPRDVPPEAAALPGDGQLSCAALAQQIARMEQVARHLRARLAGLDSAQGELWPGSGNGDMMVAMSIQAERFHVREQLQVTAARDAHLRGLFAGRQCSEALLPAGPIR